MITVNHKYVSDTCQVPLPSYSAGAFALRRGRGRFGGQAAGLEIWAQGAAAQAAWAHWIPKGGRTPDYVNIAIEKLQLLDIYSDFSHENRDFP